MPTEKISAKRKSLKNGLSKPFLRHLTLAGAEGLEAEWGFNQMLFNHPHCYIVLYSVFLIGNQIHLHNSLNDNVKSFWYNFGRKMVEELPAELF